MVKPLSLDGLHWPSVEHYYHACKYKQTAPEHYRRFSLESKHDISKGIIGIGKKKGTKQNFLMTGAAAKNAAGKTANKKYKVQWCGEERWRVEGKRVMCRALRARFLHDPDSRRLLLATKKAKLIHLDKRRGQKATYPTQIGLMLLRDELRKKRR